ncbi:aldose 1-epimerase [Prosthecobacter fusiformis]|uniref:Aldose 1-epimerase n=1 Tax=Prosthecobacter fusiformis TaxID=48464 RepID=A0A4V3FDY3_9BACT|nr:aldose epimerase family protein [Prosthecobacter fusiformis]TDU62554.1 aldose 1-epimerase [Prosthecobacter fusiformis]
MLRCALFAAALAFMSLSLPAAATVTTQSWGKTAAGEDVELFTLTNEGGMEVRVMTYGGILVSVKVPDKAGAMADVVLGFDTLEPYLGKHPHFGCITGRYANRIGGAEFEIDGVTYEVTANSGKNHIHGGRDAFDKKVWRGVVLEGGDAVALTYTSADGEEGFPGKLDCTVTYRLTKENELAIEYQAVTDKPTVVNLTNHSYFNLAGEGSGDVLGHELMIPAETYTATDDALIPTGEIESVLETPLDFTVPQLIGSRIGVNFKPLVQGKGYDHNYVLEGAGLKLAARVREPASGRVMEVRTTDPAVQLYTGNHLKAVMGKGGHVYESRHGFCLETQKYPDSPNKPQFPSAVVRPGEPYVHTTIFKFSAE